MIQSGEFQATAVVISRLSMVVADSFLETSMIEEGFPMNGVAQQTGIDTTLKAACRYAMEKGNRFARGPAYKSHGKKVLSSVGQTARWYEGMGYTKLMEFDDPPVYAVLKRGRHEVHIFQTPDPTLRAWLENDEAALDDPALHAYLLQKSGLDEWELPVASKPHYFHLNEVDDVFIATADEAQ